LQCLGEVAGADAFEIQPGDQCVDALDLTQIRRKNIRGEPITFIFRPTIMHTRHLYPHGPHAGDDGSLLGMTVANHLAVAAWIEMMCMVVDPSRGLGLDGLDKHLESPMSQHIGQWIMHLGAGRWQHKRFGGKVLHGGVLLPVWAVEGACHTPKVRCLFHDVIHRFRLYLFPTFGYPVKAPRSTVNGESSDGS